MKEYIQIGPNLIPYSTITMPNGETRYRVRLTKGINKDDGKKKEYDIKATSINELTNKLENALQPYSYLLAPGYRNITFMDVAKKFLKSGEKVWVKRTRDNYAKKAEELGQLIGEYCLFDITPDYLQQIVNHLVDIGKTRSCISVYCILLRNIFKYAIAERYIVTNPALRLKYPRSIKIRRESLSPDQQLKLLEEFKKYPIYENIVGTNITCGGRISEVLGLTWDKYDPINKSILIGSELQWDTINGHLVPKLKHYTKTGVVHTVFIPDYGAEYLEKQRARQQRYKNILGKKYKETIPNLIFTNIDGSPINYNRFLEKFVKVRKDLGESYSKFTIHSLRHTAATNFYYSSDKDLLATQELLGHEDIRNTVLYTHCRPEDKIKAAEIMDLEHKKHLA